MSRRPLRIATTDQLFRSVQEAGFEAYMLPKLPSLNFNRSLSERINDGPVYRDFLERHDIELLVDFNASALTLLRSSSNPEDVLLTNAALKIPYVACYLDPITSTMAQVDWSHHWQLLESPAWIKWVWESAHSEELVKLGVRNVLTMPMACGNDDFDTNPLPEPDDGPAVVFMGHPATSWFAGNQPIASGQLLAGLTAAAVHADMPDLPFHKIFFDLHEFACPPRGHENVETRAQMALDYYRQKFVYNAWLAVKQRDRFARFLKAKLGDAFELIGDHWGERCGLKHTPRIWDARALQRRIRGAPICLNLMKGCLETGLNFRHFEITAYGGFMLTYATAELGNCFEVGEECDVFHHEEELLEKISYYLHHPERRRAVAAAGQRRTLSRHLYSHRLTTLVDTLRESGCLLKTNEDGAPRSDEHSSPIPLAVTA